MLEISKVYTFWWHLILLVDSICSWFIWNWRKHAKHNILETSSKPSQNSLTPPLEVMLSLQFKISTLRSPKSELIKSAFHKLAFSFLCTPETNAGCKAKQKSGNKKEYFKNKLGHRRNQPWNYFLTSCMYSSFQYFTSICKQHSSHPHLHLYLWEFSQSIHNQN